MSPTLEQRFLDIAHDVLLAVSEGELPPDAPVVRAAARAIATLREAGQAAGRPDGPAVRGAPAGGPGPEPAGAPLPVPGGASGHAVSGRVADPAGRPSVVGPAVPAPAGARAPRLVAPFEHVLAVADLMRGARVPFPAACARQAAESGVSAQAVRNACCRWLEANAADWQPLAVLGADAPALDLARRLADRAPWARARIAVAFRVDAAQLGAEASS